MQSDSEAAADNCNINRIGSAWRVRMFHRSWFQVTLVLTCRTTREIETALPHVLHLRQCPNQMEHTSPSGDTGVFSSAVEKLGIASNGGDERAMGETASRGRSLGVAGNTHGDTGWLDDWHELSLPGAIDCSRSPGCRAATLGWWRM